MRAAHGGTHDGPREQLEREPNVAHQFHVEERLVRICTVLAQRPLHGRILARGWRPVFGHGDVPQRGHSQVGVSLQRERQHGHAYKKHGNHGDHLERTTSVKSKRACRGVTA